MNTKKVIIIGAIIILLLISKKVKAESIIAKFEGLRLRAYLDGANIWTIGYGSTKNPFTGEKVKEGDVITQETALAWLREEIKARTSAIKKLVKVPINDNQLAALTSLAYNIGLGAFQRSTLLRLLNNKAPLTQVADQFLVWNRIKGVVSRGLTNRRQLERELFLK